MSIVVFIQINSITGDIPKSSISAVNAAVSYKKNTGTADDIIGVVFASQTVANNARYAGLSKVIYIDDLHFQKYFFADYRDVILSIMKNQQAKVFITTATSIGKDLSPHIASALEAGQASDIIAVNSDATLRRPMYAGDILADISITTGVKVITVRGSSFDGQLLLNEAEVTLEKFDPLPPDHKLGLVEKVDAVAADRPELGDAGVIVSGGRALQSAENFEKYIFPLADALGAAVGASRAAVDSGYAPNDWQVGQTGKIVAPNLYVAVGISGAIQHLAGMKDSKMIVAINKDADAPIYEVSDYGLVADLFTTVPELTEKIIAAKK